MFANNPTKNKKYLAHSVYVGFRNIWSFRSKKGVVY